jgi:hypothetical protein
MCFDDVTIRSLYKPVVPSTDLLPSVLDVLGPRTYFFQGIKVENIKTKDHSTDNGVMFCYCLFDVITVGLLVRGAWNHMNHPFISL